MIIEPAGFALPQQDQIDRLVAVVAPGARVHRLGGFMGLNLHLEGVAADQWPATDVVLRIHPRYLTRRRLRAVQDVRDRVNTATPSTLLRWIDRTRNRMVTDGAADPSAIEVSDRLRRLAHPVLTDPEERTADP